MRNPIQAIVEFNVKADLLSAGFEDKKESAYLIEEALEPYDVSYLGKLLCLDLDKGNSHKHVARGIIANVLPSKEPMTKIETIDKYIDAIVFAVGALAKQGLSHQDITQLINIVNECNMKKLLAGKDSEGKQMKPADWVGPEEKIYNHLLKRDLL